MPEKSALFVVSTANQIGSLAPVARELQNAGWKTDILSLQNYIGLKLKFPEDIFHQPILLEAETPLDDVQWKADHQKLEALGRECFASASKLMTIRQWTVVVVGNDRGFIERIVLHHARRSGAKTVLVQDGILSSQSFVEEKPGVLGQLRQMLRLFAGRLFPSKYGYLPFVKGWMPAYGADGCDLICCAENGAADSIRYLGVPPYRVHVTGQPRYDVFALPANDAATAIQTEISMRFPKQTPLLFASQPMVDWGEVDADVYYGMLHKLFIAFDKRADQFAVIVRPHPAENADVYEALLLQSGISNGMVYRGGAIQDLIRATAGLITAYSTCALEAVMLDRPLLLVNPFGVEQGLPYAIDGVAVEVNTLDNLVSALDAAFCEPGVSSQATMRPAFLQKYTGPIDGKSACRVAEFIEGTIQGSKSQTS